MKKQPGKRQRVKASFSEEITDREQENRGIAYQAALEGIVLLRNNGVLPLKPGKTALFGAGARRTIKGGTGSGEVNERHSVTIAEGLEARGFSITTSPWLDDYDREFLDGLNDFESSVRKRMLSMDISEMSNIVANPYQYPWGREISRADISKSDTDTCIYVIARQAGEASDRRLENNDISLSRRERDNLKICAEEYENTIVVINVGSSFDVEFIEEIPGIDALIHFGQQGTHGGTALGDILSGKVSPSGKLTDTWAKSYDDIPFAREYSYLNGDLENEYYREGIYIGYRYFDSFRIQPRFEFGFGLGYSEFEITPLNVRVDKTRITVTARVTNRGTEYSGKEVAQIYVSCPQSGIPKEYQRLAAFAKTGELAPGEFWELELAFDLSEQGSYDEHRGVLFLEPGEYLIRLGNSSRNTDVCAVIELDKEAVISRHTSYCPIQNHIQEIDPPAITYDDDLSGVPRLTVNSGDFVCRDLTSSGSSAEGAGGQSGSDADVPNRLLSQTEIDEVDELMSKLTTGDMLDLVVGSGMMQVYFGGTYFTSPGAIGNTTSKLVKKGIPNITFADGPAGLRLMRRSALKKSGRVKMIDPHLDIFKYFPGFIRRIFFGNEKKDRLMYQFTTAFPVELSLAQTWNTAVLEDVGRGVSREMSEFGITFWLAPGLNIHRNPLCGRNFEYYSEDPFLSGKLGAAVIRGCQERKGNFATVKHFVANNQEENRNSVSSNMSERTLRELYLRGFEIAVKEGKARGVMTSYNKLNGIYTPNSRDLCTGILRGEWHFDGVVISDWLATGRTRADDALCIAAGNDLIMPGDGLIKGRLKAGLRRGVFSREELRRSSKRILKCVVESELFRSL